MKTKIFLITILSVGLLGANVFAAEPNDIYVIRIADAISPGTAEYIKSGIRTAEENGAACIIIELDTPGGLAESMRLIVQNILASRVWWFLYFPAVPGRLQPG